MDINDIAVLAVKDEKIFENLLNEYKPFIFSQIKKVMGQPYISEQDDSYSIGLTSFYEAVKTYDINKGSFISHAACVIKNRTIDYLRSNYKSGNVIPLYVVDYEHSGEVSEEAPYIQKKSIEDYNIFNEQEATRDEIKQLEEELAKWGISFAQMEKDSPKHKRFRDEIWHVINTALENEEIRQTILIKKYLPIKKICEKIKIPPKKIENTRNYIVSCVIIAAGEYPILRSYLKINDNIRIVS